VVNATTNDASSGAQALRGRSGAKAGRARGGRRQGSGFAAILEKALNGVAAPEKAGKARISAQNARLKSLRPARTEETAEKQARKSPRPASKPELSAELKAGKRAEELSALAAQPREVKILSGGDFSPEQESAVRAASLKDRFAETAALREALVSPGMYGAEAASAAAEGTKAEGAKTVKPAGEGKKVSLKQEAGAPRRKESREEAAKRNEKAADLVRETKPASAEDVKRDDSRQEIEIRVTFRAGDERFDDTLRTTDERSVKESASGLLRRMRDEGNAQIVKSARFILTDKNEGEIRLVLKPESLGEVRIRLSMQDNLIGGRILVENESVREVFEQNMPGLASAFKESGFEMGSMNVSVGNGDTRESEEKAWSFAEKRAATEKEVLPSTAAAAYYFISHAINLMA
jgi:flagellar hook-length control protein FliK